MWASSSLKQGVALTGRNRTDPLCSVCRLTAHKPGLAAADRPGACLPAALQMTTTTTNVSEQNNTGPLDGPVTMLKLLIVFGISHINKTDGNNIIWIYTVGHKKHTKMCFAITFIKLDGFWTKLADCFLNKLFIKQCKQMSPEPSTSFALSAETWKSLIQL